MEWHILGDALDAVAPHEGAWIEIESGASSGCSSSVAPHEGAWIEMIKASCSTHCLPVAPHEGAWIEMCRSDQRPQGKQVAPHDGAWIEMRPRGRGHERRRGSPLPEGRGLKQAWPQAAQRPPGRPSQRDVD